MATKHSVQRALLCLVAGLAFTLGLSPFDLKLASIASVGCLFLAIQGQGWRQGALLGWIYGVGFFGAGVSWVYVSIHIYGQAPVGLAAALTAIFCGGLALLTGIQSALFCAVQPRDALSRIALFTALWVVFEWVRTWFLTGFPWLFIGYAAIDTPIEGWAPVLGVLGVSLILVSTACTAAEVLNVKTRRSAAYLGLWLLVIMSSGFLMKTVEWTQKVGAENSVAIYQPNIAIEENWDRRNAQRFLSDFYDHAVTHAAVADLVVWPEGALPFYFDQAPGYITQLRELATENGATIITGMPTRAAGQRFNSIVAVGEDLETYNKQKLVPFGEFVPWESQLRGLISFFDMPMSNFSVGDSRHQPLTTVAGPLAPFICYEIVYPDFVAEGSKDSNILITISNDAWFGTSHGPHQHFQMARYRALELQKPLVRGANNGITALVDFNGDVAAQLPQFERDTLRAQVQPRSGLTPYAQHGNGPVLLISLLFLAFVIIKAQRHRR